MGRMVASHSRSLASAYLSDSKVGVIDIGSNSVRLVVYDGMKRVPLPIYNEKIFCSLGKGLGSTNRLNPQGVKLARRAIAQLLASVKMMRISELHIIATAALRDADDGKAFVKELERAHGVRIKVISGKKEAKYAAYGIFSTHHRPRGLVGDLGGGSLELISLEEPDISLHDTLPLGPLRLLDSEVGSSRELLRDITCKHLNQLEWLRDRSYEHFYAVGGSFRALAKMHMKQQGYPLEILDHYEVESPLMLAFLEAVIECPDERITQLEVSSRRQPQMPAAAVVLREILKMAQAKTVIFSTSGIREGLLYSYLSPYLQKEDPLFATCMEFAAGNGRNLGYHKDLFEWMAPLLRDESEAEARLRLAACMLGELAWRIYRPSRAEWAYFMVLRSSLTGVSHTERVALAAALYHRYQPKWKESWRSYGLLNERWRSWAALVGSAMRLGHYLSGGVPGNLAHSSLKLDGGRPKLRMSREAQPLQGESCETRLSAMLEAYGVYTRSENKV